MTTHSNARRLSSGWLGTCSGGVGAAKAGKEVTSNGLDSSRLRGSIRALATRLESSTSVQRTRQTRMGPMPDSKKHYPQVLRDCGWVCVDDSKPSIWRDPKTGQTQGMPNPLGVPDIVIFCINELLAHGWETVPVGFPHVEWEHRRDQKEVFRLGLERATIDAYIEMKRPEWEAGDE